MEGQIVEFREKFVKQIDRLHWLVINEGDRYFVEEYTTDGVLIKNEKDMNSYAVFLDNGEFERYTFEVGFYFDRK